MSHYNFPCLFSELRNKKVLRERTFCEIAFHFHLRKLRKKKKLLHWRFLTDKFFQMMRKIMSRNQFNINLYVSTCCLINIIYIKALYFLISNRN